MNGLRLLTLEEKSALAVLAGAVDRCRKEDLRTLEVLASLNLLARRTSTRWPFEQFKESLNFSIGDPSHAEGRWQNVHAQSLPPGSRMKHQRAGSSVRGPALPGWRNWQIRQT
jgi:hypothetical protein